jgi:hypothetical protein
VLCRLPLLTKCYLHLFGTPGGNLFLCEGCPTVAHAKCYGISRDLEEDWYCKPCTKRNKHKKGTTTIDSAAAASESHHPETTVNQKDPETIKQDHDGNGMNREELFPKQEVELEEILENLKQTRQKQIELRRPASGLQQETTKDDHSRRHSRTNSENAAMSNLPPCEDSGTFIRQQERTIYFAEENDIVWKIAVWCGVSHETLLEMNVELHRGITKSSKLRELTAIVLPSSAHEPDRTLKKAPAAEPTSATGKRKRGRPRKSDATETEMPTPKKPRPETLPSTKKRPRGRPRKQAVVDSPSESEYNDEPESIVEAPNKKVKADEEKTIVPIDKLPVNAEANTFTRDSTRSIYFAVENDVLFKIADVCEVPVELVLAINKTLHRGIAKRSKLREYTPVVLPVTAKCPEDALFVDPGDFKYEGDPDDSSSEEEESDDEEEKEQPKRGRGRPRKNVARSSDEEGKEVEDEGGLVEQEPPSERRRGRPPKKKQKTPVRRRPDRPRRSCVAKDAGSDVSYTDSITALDEEETAEEGVAGHANANGDETDEEDNSSLDDPNDLEEDGEEEAAENADSSSEDDDVNDFEEGGEEESADNADSGSEDNDCNDLEEGGHEEAAENADSGSEDDERDDKTATSDDEVSQDEEALSLELAQALRPLHISLRMAVFDHVLWPVLLENGWTSKTGTRPTDVTYHAPCGDCATSNKLNSLPRLVAFLKTDSTLILNDNIQDGVELFECCMSAAAYLKGVDRLPARCTAEYLVNVVNERKPRKVRISL